MSRPTLDPAGGTFVSCTRLSLSLAGFPKTFLLASNSLLQSITPERTRSGLGSFPFARRYSGNRCFFLFLRVLRCFSSPGSLPCVMDWRMDDWCCPAGFPHSEICGSSDICSFPQLIAAYHVFLRLLVPRHPPCALSCLTSHTAYSVTPYMLIASSFTLVFVRCISSSS